jgi:4-hydroxyproline epimerase
LLKVDVSYGGNFYAIVEAQENYTDLADYSVLDLIGWSPVLRQRLNEMYRFQHPELADINRLSHILWTGKPTKSEAHARNAVFYGEKAIDRSPCGTGTSARMAQLAARGELKAGDSFVHESVIGSLFHGRVEADVQVADKKGIIPSIAGWARMTGYNTIFIDDRDPFAHGFVVR